MKLQLRLWLGLILFWQTTAGQTGASQQPFFFTGNGIRRPPIRSAECGEQVRILATGEIRVGYLAGNRTPDGVARYSNNQYNIFPDKPHCALMVCIIEESETRLNLNDYANWGWQVCGSNTTFIAKKSGYLIFDLNESRDWRWDNAPVGRGFQVVVSMPDVGNRTVLGKLDGANVSRMGNKVSYKCREFDQSPDGFWYIADENNQPVGLCSAQQPHVYQYIGQNPRGSKGNVYGDTETHEVVMYQGKQVRKSTSDKRWYLKDRQGFCEGIVDPVNDRTDGLSYRIRSDDEELSNWLNHLNRNYLNREAKGVLHYLCSRAGGDWAYQFLPSCDDDVFRFYYDEAGCIWMLAEEDESVYHPHPNDPDQPGLKFTRRTGSASFESVRIPRIGETRNNLVIQGRPFTYELNGQTKSSVNVMDSPSRGSYNFNHSACYDINAKDATRHILWDVKPHEAGYTEYMIFPERFSRATTDELNLIKRASQLPVNGNERTCPVR